MHPEALLQLPEDQGSATVAVSSPVALGLLEPVAGPHPRPPLDGPQRP